MPQNISALNEKRRSLASIAANAELNPIQVEHLLRAFVRLTPPVEPRENEVGNGEYYGWISIHSSFREANSRKPGNLLLSWKKLFDVGPDIAIAGAGAASATTPAFPWMVSLGALYIWNKVLVGATVPLTEKEATILLALWENRNGKNEVAEPAGLIHANNLRQQHGMPGLSLIEYTKALSHLATIRCVEINSGIVWLCESVEVKWS